MSQLNKSDILNLERELKKTILKSSLFKANSKELIAVNFIRAGQRHSRLYLDNQRAFIEGSQQECETHLLIPASDVISFGLWHIDDIKLIPYGDVLDNDLDIAFRDLANYILVWDYFRLCLGGHAICCEVGPNSYSIAPVGLDRQISAFEKMLDTKYIGHLFPVDQELIRLVQNCEQDFNSNSELNEYLVNSSKFAALRNYLFSTIPNPFFEETLNCGGYTFRDWRVLWATLLSVSMITRRTRTEGEFLLFDNMLFGNQICNLSELPGHIVKKIVKDLLPEERYLKNPDTGFCSPLLEVESKILLFSELLTQSQPDDLLYNILQFVRPKKFEDLKGIKERLQLDRLSKMFQETRYELFEDFDVTSSRGNTNLDLLIIDRDMKTALCCQLKAPAQPRWVNLVQYVADELEEGIHQCDKSLEWLALKPESVVQRCNLTASQLSDFQNFGLVISSRSLGGGQVKRRPDIPVTNEVLIERLLNNVKRGGLIDGLWRWTKSAYLLPVEDIDYKLNDGNLTLAGKTFTISCFRAEFTKKGIYVS